MTQEQILEGNKIIADHIMVRYDSVCEGRGVVSRWLFPGKELYQYKQDELKFHSDWNWLMPAYREIVLSLKDLYNRTRISGWAQYPTEANKHLTDLNKRFGNYCFQNDILKAFELIAEKIEWYNKNK